MDCIICGSNASGKNDGLFLQRLGVSYTYTENKKIQEILEKKQGLCLECKQEMLFANILNPS